MSGAATVSFLYDGDGKQVKAVVGSTTTYYVGMHYQVDNGVVTKYYLAGATRIAMRKNGTLYYLVGDHASTMLSTSASTALSTSLGSTSLTLNASGTKIAELRYKAWGETRYTSGTTYTAYQFREAPCKGTAQRNETSLGLYFYREASRRDNARWPRSVPKAQRRGYDPSLGRFTSADTIVPTQTQGVQAWDRYAFVNNNPVRYTDPSGHKACDEELGCNTDPLPLPVPPPDSGGDEENGKPKSPGGLDDIVQKDDNATKEPELTSPEDEEGDTMVTIAGTLLLVQLEILDGILGYGIIAVAICGVTVPGCQLGLAGELIFIPLEFVSVNLTLYAAQMAATGSTKHDPLPLLHARFPDFLPYKP